MKISVAIFQTFMVIISSYHNTHLIFVFMSSSSELERGKVGVAPSWLTEPGLVYKNKFLSASHRFAMSYIQKI